MQNPHAINQSEKNIRNDFLAFFLISAQFKARCMFPCFSCVYVCVCLLGKCLLNANIKINNSFAIKLW